MTMIQKYITLIENNKSNYNNIYHKYMLTTSMHTCKACSSYRQKMFQCLEYGYYLSLFSLRICWINLLRYNSKKNTFLRYEWIKKSFIKRKFTFKFTWLISQLKKKNSISSQKQIIKKKLYSISKIPWRKG